MKKIKVQTWILFAIILVQIGVMFLWLGKKEGVHIDEMYSLESAHYLKYGVTRLTELDEWYGAWHTADDFNQYFTVNSEDSFWTVSFKDKLHLIAKYPLSEILLNIVLSATPGEYSLVKPVLLNMIFFILLQILLYRIGIFYSGSRWNALLAPLFFGFSAGAVNMVLYIRMYAMVMLFSILMVWLYMLLLEENKISIKIAYIYIGILLVTYFSYRCHQYTVLLAASLSIVYCIMRIAYKKWKWGAFHIGLLGTLGSCFVLKTGMWRAFLYGDIGSREKETLDILKERTLVEWWNYACDYWIAYLKNALGGIAVLLVIVIAVLMAVSYRKGKEDKLWLSWEEKEKQILMLTAFASIVFWLTLSRIAPDVTIRYISYLYPIGALIVAVVLNHIFCDVSRSYFAGSAVLVVAMMVIVNFKYCYIENLYEELAPIKEILHEEKYQIDNIYVNSLNRNNVYGRHQIYPDGYLWQDGLRYYVTTPEKLRKYEAPGIEECTGNAVMLWVDEEEDTYQILKDIYALTGFDTHEKLGYTQRSKVYYLTRE